VDARSQLPFPAPAGASEHDNTSLQCVLAGLRHEISRPLDALRSGIDVLCADECQGITPTQRRHLETMVVVCDDLMRLTHGYFDYACLVEGAPPLRLGTFTLKKLIDDVRKTFAPAAAARRIAWRCGFEDQNATLHTDFMRCQQICGHLVANALKYTGSGGSVCVSARSQGHAWEVCVSDNGPGIPAEFHARVFEPFFRLARDEQCDVEGCGLGLAISRAIVDQLGGTIEILGQEGPGTHLRVQLPKRAPAGCRAGGGGSSD